MPVRLLRALAVAAVISSVACAPKAPDVTGLPDVVDFNFHVRPILSDPLLQVPRSRRLGPQGGPAPRYQERSIREARVRSHPPVVPGSTRRSELVRRILSTDPAVMMPAPDSHLTLSDMERALLVRWVEQGAVWKPHWSLIPPVKPSPPQVTDARPGHNEIDAFVVSAADQARRQAGAGGGQGDAHPPRDVRPHGAASDARRDRRVRRRHIAGCVRAGRRSPVRDAPATASAWRSTGSTSRATPTRTATRTTGCGTCRRGATG